MAKPELAYCGLDCTDCKVFRATAADDDSLRAECAKEWSIPAAAYWGRKNLEARDMNCRGCRSDAAPQFVGCVMCPIRACCRAKGHENCGICPEMYHCRFISSFLEENPQAQENLLAWLAEP